MVSCNQGDLSLKAVQDLRGLLDSTEGEVPEDKYLISAMYPVIPLRDHEVIQVIYRGKRTHVHVGKKGFMEKVEVGDIKLHNLMIPTCHGVVIFDGVLCCHAFR